jgi:hypothetical protein
MAYACVYFEGGGQGKDSQRELRKGMAHFLNQSRGEYGEWRIKCVACGSRKSAYDDFVKALNDTKNIAYKILLVDSETPVNKTPWEHLAENEGWTNPNCPDDQCHLMVQIMESWIIADPSALRMYYGPRFILKEIPVNDNIEILDKSTVYDALKRATRRTEKKGYHKIRHASELLKQMDPTKVRIKAEHCDRLFKILESVL